ncbi:hypothetical protein B9Z55_023116 [Caenorhabditis nigoni]|uniref:Uncharacterized protein n=1 Tax=Caenorhabditis nigoni TaxID=1611254 RepID=A0A2G5SN34_9PELO|nr:hypothetical protein B9Z55_023116 [Caenorhabditis nigoni]
MWQCGGFVSSVGSIFHPTGKTPLFLSSGTPRCKYLLTSSSSIIYVIQCSRHCCSSQWIDFLKTSLHLKD